MRVYVGGVQAYRTGPSVAMACRATLADLKVVSPRCICRPGLLSSETLDKADLFAGKLYLRSFGSVCKEGGRGRGWSSYKLLHIFPGPTHAFTGAPARHLNSVHTHTRAVEDCVHLCSRMHTHIHPDNILDPHTSRTGKHVSTHTNIYSKYNDLTKEINPPICISFFFGQI